MAGLYIYVCSDDSCCRSSTQDEVVSLRFVKMSHRVLFFFYYELPKWKTLIIQRKLKLFFFPVKLYIWIETANYSGHLLSRDNDKLNVYKIIRAISASSKHWGANLQLIYTCMCWWQHYQQLLVVVYFQNTWFSNRNKEYFATSTSIVTGKGKGSEVREASPEVEGPGGISKEWTERMFDFKMNTCEYWIFFKYLLVSRKKNDTT